MSGETFEQIREFCQKNQIPDNSDIINITKIVTTLEFIGLVGKDYVIKRLCKEGKNGEDKLIYVEIFGIKKITGENINHLEKELSGFLYDIRMDPLCSIVFVVWKSSENGKKHGLKKFQTGFKNKLKWPTNLTFQTDTDETTVKNITSYVCNMRQRMFPHLKISLNIEIDQDAGFSYYHLKYSNVSILKLSFFKVLMYSHGEHIKGFTLSMDEKDRTRNIEMKVPIQTKMGDYSLSMNGRKRLAKGEPWADDPLPPTAVAMLKSAKANGWANAVKRRKKEEGDNDKEE